MRSVLLVAVVGLLCVAVTGCNTITNVGDGIADLITGGGVSTSVPATPAPANTPPAKGSQKASSPAQPATQAVSVDGDRGCVQAMERVSLDAAGGWVSGELCIAPAHYNSHQVKLTLSGNGGYSCQGAFCSLDVAFGDHAFRTMRVIDGANEPRGQATAAGVIFITNRDKIEKAIVQDPVMSVRIPFSSGRSAILKFDTRGLKRR